MIAVALKIDGTIPGSAIWYSWSRRATASSPSTRRSLWLVAASRTPTLFTKDATTKRELQWVNVVLPLIWRKHATEKNCYTSTHEILFSLLKVHGKSEYPMVKQKCRQWLIYQLAEHYSFEVPLRDSSRQRVWIGLYSGPKQQRYLRRWPQGRQVRDLCNSFCHFNKWGFSLDVICVKCTHQLIISALKEIWWRPARSASPQLLRLDGRIKE